MYEAVCKAPKCSILLAEDNAHEIALLNLAFRDSGLRDIVTVTYARNGLESIQALSATVWVFDLIILDLNMPLVQGKDILRHLKNGRVHKPAIIVMSNSEYETDIKESYALGADAYVLKPLQFEQLENFCRVIKDSWATYKIINLEYIKSHYPVRWPRAD